MKASDEIVDGDLRDAAVSALHDSGLIGADDAATIEPLAGGVSNDVAVVRGAGREFVVKRALPRLRVSEVWEASPERSFTEAAALRWAGEVRPEAVPPVLAVDRSRNVIVVGLAPASYGDWKSHLLAGEVRAEVGARLGDLLASWHAASSADADVLAEFADQEAFQQLRVRPFYEVAAERNPAAAPPIADLIARMSGTRTALVHGDFSPKNILVDAPPGSALWVIDWEVAHAGDPLFDVAFLVHHLVCKMIAVPSHRTELAETAAAFLDAYRAGIGGRLDETYLVRHVGALVLARVDGKSPVEYLTTAQRSLARSHALALLTSSSARITDLWSLPR